MGGSFVLPRIVGAAPFPPTSSALQDPDGLLCWGGSLHIKRLLAAYSQGIFPWNNPGEELLWWSPSQRMVLNYANLRISHSLRKTLKKIQRQDKISPQSSATKPTSASPVDYYEIKLNTAFEEVMRGCAGKRGEQVGTWISEEFIQAYSRLHQFGYAHSFETWCNGQLVGGLYGVNIGKMFFGESMFSHKTDASKIALVFAANYLARQEIYSIDCQQDTPHLRSMGAFTMSRQEFNQLLEQTIPQQEGVWHSGTIDPSILDLTRQASQHPQVSQQNHDK